MRVGDPGGDGGDVGRVLGVIGQVQALGLASAAAVAERYVGSVDRYLAGRASPPGGWEWLVQQGPTAPSSEVLRLPPVTAGGSSRGSLWVHSTGPAVTPVTVRVGPLTSAEGLVLTPVAELAGASSHPDPARTSRTAGTGSPGCSTEVGPHRPVEVRLHVPVPAGTPPGHFHGMVVCTAAPRRALPVLLEVLSPRETS